jgi:hypothetical protein
MSPPSLQSGLRQSSVVVRTSLSWASSRSRSTVTAPSAPSARSAREGSAASWDRQVVDLFRGQRLLGCKLRDSPLSGPFRYIVDPLALLLKLGRGVLRHFDLRRALLHLPVDPDHIELRPGQSARLVSHSLQSGQDARLELLRTASVGSATTFFSPAFQARAALLSQLTRRAVATRFAMRGSLSPALLPEIRDEVQRLLRVRRQRVDLAPSRHRRPNEPLGIRPT